MRFSASATAAAALLLALELAGLSAGANAQALPSDAEIKAQMAKQRANTMEALKMSPSQGAQAGNFKTDVPKVAPAPQRTQDLDALVKQYQSGKPVDLPKSGHDLIVFVSFSMPPDILKELARQAKETGAVLVLRGFKDESLAATKQAALIMNQAGAEWDIHPDLFKSFKVTKVPTFAVAAADASSVLEEGCAPETTYATISGNISIQVALDTIRRRASMPIATLAEARLERIRMAGRVGSVVR
jgi:conjugal transfer pilus assembly protein TrbC